MNQSKINSTIKPTKFYTNLLIAAVEVTACVYHISPHQMISGSSHLITGFSALELDKKAPMI